MASQVASNAKAHCPLGGSGPYDLQRRSDDTGEEVDLVVPYASTRSEAKQLLLTSTNATGLGVDHQAGIGEYAQVICRGRLAHAHLSTKLSARLLGTNNQRQHSEPRGMRKGTQPPLTAGRIKVHGAKYRRPTGHGQWRRHKTAKDFLDGWTDLCQHPHNIHCAVCRMGALMTSILSTRVLPGRHGTWLDSGERAVLVSADTDLSNPSEQLLLDLRGHGFLTEATSTYAVTAMMTTRCNLVCDYCFQAEAPGADSTRIPEHALTSANVEGIIRFVAQQMSVHGKSQADLLLTGGEPLLSFQRCCELLREVGHLGLGAAQMFTNGVLLTSERARILADLGLSHVQISFDGQGADHDRYRRDRAGRGTYTRTITNLGRAVEASPTIDYVARLNVSGSNIDSLRALIDELHGLVGCDSVQLRFGLLDDIGIGFDDASTLTERATADLLAVVLHAVDLGFTVAPLASVAKCRYCSIPGGVSGCVINADGTLYSCWESVGRDGYEVGTIDSGYLPHPELNGRWVDCSYNVQTDAQARQRIAAMSDRIDTAVLDRLFELGSAVEVSP